MAEFVGEIFLEQERVLPISGLSPNIAIIIAGIRNAALLDSFSGLSDDPVFIKDDALISAEPGILYDGEELGCFEELFEKVIVSPRGIDLGNISVDIHWNTNIWNTHRNTIADMIDIEIPGTGGLDVINPHGMPLPFAPLQSYDLDTVAHGIGDAMIDGEIIFVFPGDTGTGTRVTGSRVMVFPAEPDWSDPLIEQTQYLTGMMASYSAAEQRMALRSIPRTRLSWRVLQTDAISTAALDALLYGCQGRVLSVPFWPDARALTGNAVVGSDEVHCDTGNTKFRPGGLALIWRDFFTYESASVAGVSPDVITLTAPLNGDWAADGRTYVVPMLTGRWDGAADMDIITPKVVALNAEFQCDASPDVDPVSPPVIYGYDVLEIQPNQTQDRNIEYSRTMRIADFSTGPVVGVDRSGVAAARQGGFLWTQIDRNEVAELRAWFALRRGRHQAFWAPTWRHDLIQAVPLEAGNRNLTIRWSGYSRYQFPQPARRYLRFAMLDGSGVNYYCRVTDAYESGSTEVLVLDGPATSLHRLDVGSCMISFLRLVRLASDDLGFTWHTRDVAESSLEFIEVPLEVAP